jgi:hypothetical protein
MSPAGVLNVTRVMPGPPDTVRRIGMFSRRLSHEAIRSAVGLSCSAWTSPASSFGCGWSSVAASSVRHGVARVQPKSVSPGL